MKAATVDPGEYYQRVLGLISAAFHTRRILAVGCGAGSYMLAKLARAGPAEMRLLDFDVVEVANLCRTAYQVGDLGRLKVEALADHIRQANPFVGVRTLASDICRLGPEEQAALTNGVDLIIAGTDHFPAQALINHWSQQYKIPAVFIGIHEGALGGRVIWSVPGQTPCYRCVARQRYDQFARSGLEATDMAAAHGLLADVQFIDMVALKVCLALLECGQDSAAGRFCRQMGKRNEIIVRTSPEYRYGTGLWHAILSDLPQDPKPYAREIEEQALFAMDTIWLPTEFMPDCPDCGGSPAIAEAIR